MTSGQINCPAPLPEGPADARLVKLLVPAPYVVSEKKVKKKATRTQKSALRPEVSDSPFKESKTHSSHEDEEEEEETPPPSSGGREEKEGRPYWGGRRVQEGENPSSGLLHQRRRRRRGVATEG